jgi:hypothetical protein
MKKKSSTANYRPVFSLERAPYMKKKSSIANYRPVFSLEREPYMKKKSSNCESEKFKIWSSDPKGNRHPR